ncbi:hypothetical protein [Corynebacterium cystitidis]|uniref:Uncharacterized protein n=1 Tax=Corynebacterium cystitidis DSM 20524 TaxID=1121357 RepID=A0A1H9TVH2_9CORY|nr:hypothetical protein [Corynebacterium cystitidis]WJY81920.1 hypothetical protein CCYS_04885 [Corynebacterium cystitidis DSM 20524]SES01370.1 hypothetical protein SAMN05661109_01585 [Corynebacterium cystitidis DSM 20524]SNV82014.1 Uncharacterised protein [Corynebacterium cystitidis]
MREMVILGDHGCFGLNRGIRKRGEGLFLTFKKVHFKGGGLLIAIGGTMGALGGCSADGIGEARPITMADELVAVENIDEAHQWIEEHTLPEYAEDAQESYSESLIIPADAPQAYEPAGVVDVKELMSITDADDAHLGSLMLSDSIDRIYTHYGIDSAALVGINVVNEDGSVIHEVPWFMLFLEKQGEWHFVKALTQQVVQEENLM